MNIAIDIRGTYLYHGTGIGTYTKNLVNNLLSIDHENFYELFYCGGNPDQFKLPHTEVHLLSKKFSSFYEQEYIPSFIRRKNIPIFHIPQNGIGYKELLSSKRYKSIVTVHDLIPYVLPQTVGRSYLNKFLKQMPYIVDNASAIITVSEYSKKEIIKFFSIDPNKIFVTPLATNKLFRPLNITACKEILKKKYSIDYDFILYIGGFSKRKNIYNLILAFAQSYKNFSKPTKLILLGNIKDEYNILKEIIREKNLDEYVTFTGFIPEEDLPIFYNASEFFVYISKYEGFGLPLLEALSCRKATISSNITSIPEVVGSASYAVNPYDVYKISKSLCDLSNNHKLRSDLEGMAYDRSKMFSWENCASLTLDVYKNLNNDIKV